MDKDFEDKMDKDFERSLEKIPYRELLNDPDFKKQLRKEYESVTAIDHQLSRQKFIERHLTPDELEILNELDLTPKSGYYFQNEAEQKRDALAKEFDEMEQIPEKFRVKNIKQTPTYEALYAINRFINEYTDLALRDVDTIVIADKYFILLKNKLETFSPSVQIKLIDEIMLPEVNIAVWMHKKFHPDENVNEYQKRWEQLKNSLNANLISYKSEVASLLDSACVNPPSLQIEINKGELTEIFESWKSNAYRAIDGKTDFDYFSYAVSGKPIPTDKQPYRPIRITTSIVKFRLFLKEVLQIKQKTIPNDIKKKVTSLFVDKNGKPVHLYN
ncbi:MAG: hypothetical protein PWQ53_212 [Bacteroidota bacterium]|nr:hypothetical protein [Bacteroidota bacterium]